MWHRHETALTRGRDPVTSKQIRENSRDGLRGNCPVIDTSPLQKLRHGAFTVDQRLVYVCEEPPRRNWVMPWINIQTCCDLSWLPAFLAIIKCSLILPINNGRMNRDDQCLSSLSLHTFFATGGHDVGRPDASLFATSLRARYFEWWWHASE